MTEIDYSSLSPYEQYLGLFDKRDGAIYFLTKKESPADLTRADFQLLFKAIPAFPQTMSALLSRDDAELTRKVTPNGMTSGELHHLALQELARQGRPTDVFRDSASMRTVEERDKTVTLNGETLNLKKSEAYAYALNQALMLAGPATDLTDEQKRARDEFMKDLTDQERRSIVEVDSSSDTKMLSAGYATGAIPQFSPRLNPNSPNTLNISIGNPDTTIQQIQDWYCGELNKVYSTSSFGVDQKTAYTLGFIQARTDARNNFEVSGGVGITEPCPPAQTPNTGVAESTSAAPTPAGGGKASPQR